ncbi:Protein of unknown function (DUF2927) [Hasllibacter halocynthiae]|uniref:DUF2927 family protein n=1 Tax=Hasllibacter halocynthiae TaxID=595589 RepID=A0A2T0X6F7_9RHOB|nr:DUF2927 domain-containing protein [Hasllibacter halocynthiae]PRY94541.1 Protein of unknown function (DUF2927) [Hasllibacter halocynthiae]
MGGTAGIKAWAGAALVGAALSGCVPVPEAAPPPPPPPPPTAAPETSPSPDARGDRLVEETTRYYAGLQRSLLARGLLRTERAPSDAPFDARDLTESFVRVALFDEYDSASRQRATPSPLRRFAAPVRLALRFDARVPTSRRALAERELTAYARRLSEATRHPVGLGTPPNFHVLVLTEPGRRAAAPLLRELVPGISAGAVRTVTNMPGSINCLVLAFTPPGAETYTQAVAVIRAEHPDLLFRGCIHEEVAQGLGLANDSPAARPSIFNDDEEFGLLTEHDELLLRILYDPRLRPGMGAAEARPVVRGIAEELLAGPGPS